MGMRTATRWPPKWRATPSSRLVSQEAVNTKFNQWCRLGRIGFTGANDDGQIRLLLANASTQVNAADVRQVYIQEDDINRRQGRAQKPSAS